MTPTDIRKLCIRLDTTEDSLYQALSSALDELDERRCGVSTLSGVGLSDALHNLSILRRRQHENGAR